MARTGPGLGENRVTMTDPHVSDGTPGPPGGRTELTTAQLKAAAATFDLLSTPVRLHLAWLAAQGEYDVGTLAGRAGVSIATASQHLSKLRLAGVITAHRTGRRQIYTVDDPHVLTLIEQIFDHIAPDGSLAPDPPPRRTRTPGSSTVDPR
jgi:DNA-binding transcriptional ArsR family regulator